MKPFIRLGVALTVFWMFSVSCIVYVQYELAAEEGMFPEHATFFITMPDGDKALRVTKANWLFDRHEEVVTANESVDIYSNRLIPDTVRLSILVCVPIGAVWISGILAIWTVSGFKSKNISSNSSPLVLSNNLRDKEHYIPQAETLNLSETPLPLTMAKDFQDGAIVNQGKASVSWWMYLLHVWCGICLKAAGDIGRVKGAAVVAVLLVGGFYLSKLIVARIDALQIKPSSRKALIIWLVPSYFLLAVAIGWLIGLRN